MYQQILKCSYVVIATNYLKGHNYTYVLFKKFSTTILLSDKPHFDFYEPDETFAPR